MWSLDLVSSNYGLISGWLVLKLPLSASNGHFYSQSISTVRRHCEKTSRLGSFDIVFLLHCVSVERKFLFLVQEP